MKTHLLLYVHTTMMYRKRLSKQTPHIYYVLKVKSFTAQGIFIGFPREWIAFVMLMWHSWRTSGNNKLFLSFSFSEIVQYCFFLPVFCPAYIIIIVIILIIMMCIDKWSMHKWKVGGCTSKCWLDWSFCIKPYNKWYLSGFKCITVFPRQYASHINNISKCSSTSTPNVSNNICIQFLVDWHNPNQYCISTPKMGTHMNVAYIYPTSGAIITMFFVYTQYVHATLTIQHNIIIGCPNLYEQ